MKYRKKPVVIEAKRFDTTAMFEELSKLHEWVTGEKIYGAEIFMTITENKGYPIKTLEGTMLASHGDYIIKGVNGEFYPCKPCIFEKTYEAVDATDTDLVTATDKNRLDFIEKNWCTVDEGINEIKINLRIIVGQTSLRKAIDQVMNNSVDLYD